MTKVAVSQPNLWTEYRVHWMFLTRICASVPADPEIVKKWIDAREPRVKPPARLSIGEINEEVCRRGWPVLLRVGVASSSGVPWPDM
jgi:hypothetical protein